MRGSLTLSNAREQHTPHRVGQVAKAQAEIEGLLSEWGSPDTVNRSAVVVTTMLDLGWTPPRDPNIDVPPLAGPGADPDSPGRRAFNEARAALNARRNTPARTVQRPA